MRDYLAPVCGMVAVFATALILIVAGHHDTFDRHTTNLHPELGEGDRIAAVHRAATGESAEATSANLISSSSRAGRLIERFANRVLFELQPDRSVPVLLSFGTFTRAGRKIVGIRQAADLVFGARVETLTDSEIALYCTWIVHGQAGWGPEEVISTREQVLARLHRASIIDEATWNRLNDAPLVIRPTPIPIY